MKTKSKKLLDLAKRLVDKDKLLKKHIKNRNKIRRDMLGNQ